MNRFSWLDIPLLVVVPVALAACGALQLEQSALLTLAVCVAALALFFARYEGSRPRLEQVMPTVVLAALAAAGRILFAPMPSFKPVTAICIIAGATFGRRSGFMVGALAALVSNFFFGHGPWTPWQMYAWGLVGYMAGVFGGRGWLSKRGVLLTFGFVSALVYGVFLNGYYALGYVVPITWEGLLAAYAAALPLDIVHGVATVVFLAALYLPWQRKLERIKRKYAEVL